MSSRLAVFGSPISHSKSPVLHRAAYEALGVGWSYEAREVTEADFGTVLATLDHEWRGLSLTMPLKSAAHQAADELDEVAALTGVVNTLRFIQRGDRRMLHGYNTDVAGIIGALRAIGTDTARNAHLFGSGATAASAVVAIAELGAGHVSVLARTPGKAEELHRLATSVGLTMSAHGFDELDALETPDLVISTLPGGIFVPGGYPDETMRTSTLLDVAYDPWPSPRAGHWQHAGGKTANGLSMLAHQALIQVRIFAADDPFQELPDEPAVLAAMLASVGLDERGRPLAA